MRSNDFDSDRRLDPAPKVLLANTTRWACTTRIALALSKAGCIVSAVCPTRHPLVKTRGVQRIFPYSGIWPLASLAAAIEEAHPQLIIPFDDRATDHMHELFWQLRDAGPSGNDVADLIERSLGSSESFAIVSSRYELLKIARQEGLRVPDTHQIDRATDFDALRPEGQFPLVLKADGTFGGNGVKIANTREEAKQFLSELINIFGLGRAVKRWCVNRDAFWLRPWWRHSRPQVVAQSYIHGRPANCAFACWNGAVIAGICADVVSADGATGPASVVRVVNSTEMMKCAERLARRLRLSGLFGLDFMIEKGTNAAYLIEMNPRPTPLCHLQLGSGRDLIGALYAQLSGQPLREMPPITENDTISYFPDAVNSNSTMLRRSFHDIPVGEVELIKELLHPWPTQSLLFRLYALMDRVSRSDRPP